MSFLWGNTAAQPTDPKKFAHLNADQVNSNQQGVPVKYLAGRQYVGGDYISPAYNPKAVPVKTKTGKSEESTTGYKYFADFALMFCMGGRHPVDAVYKVIIDADIRWKGTITRGAAHKEVFQVEDLGTIHLWWGTETQGIDNVLLTPRTPAASNQQDSTTWDANPPVGSEPVLGDKAAGDANPYSGHYDEHPAYRGQCYAVFKNWKLGRDRVSVPNIQLELERGCPWYGGGNVTASAAGVDPAALLFDWLPDTRFGMGLPEANLDTTYLQGLYDALESIGMRISPLITSQEDFRQIIAELMEYYDGWIRRVGSTIQVGAWEKGTITSHATLTDDDLLAEPALEPQGWGPRMNEVTVIYKAKAHHYNDYTKVYRDPNNFRITGGPRQITFSRPWITNLGIAKAYARTMGQAVSMPLTRGTLEVKREWITNNNILPGWVFTYNSGFYGLSFLMRLLEIEYGSDDSAKATLTVEWERSKWPSIYVPPGFEGPGGFELGPRALWVSVLTEVTYIMTDPDFVTQVAPLAVRGNVEV